MPDPIRPAPATPVDNSATHAPSVGFSTDDTTGDARSAPSFAPPADPAEIGQIGPYRVLKQLGHGGMGAVYLGLDERLGRKLALKVMLPQYAANPAAKERFLREARAAAQITHDNVVTVYEADERDGVPFIAMQFLQGYALDEYLKKKGSPSIPQILRIARETAAGLAAAHKIGLVHRDIKPGNLWLEAPNGRVKVLDFGLARPVDAESELTKSGAIIGTPAYMSPEQGRGQKVDARTDLFSLGAVLYRLCTGKLPFEGSNVMAILMALGTEVPTPVRELNSNVPEPLADLIHQLLAKKAADRPQTADEVVKRVRGMMEKPAASDVQTASPNSTLPQVVYVTIPVTMQPESAFADLDVPDAQPAEDSLPVPQRQKPRGKLIGIAAGFAAVLALVIGGVIIIIKNKDGAETKIEVPDGATVEVKKDGKSVAKVGPTPKASADATPDRKAAEYVLSIGGTVQVSGTDKILKTASDLPKEAFQLTVVNLSQNKLVSDAGMVHFKDCKNVTHLHLENCEQVSDAGLAHFKDSKNVTSLVLRGTKVSAAGLANFKDCKNMSSLHLNAAGVDDTGLANFKDRNLTFLHLTGTQVTDTGLANFKDCKNLYYLSLGSTQVGDTGIAHFMGCKNLTYLGVTGTKLTAAKFEELKKAFPKCKIESDHGTYEPPVEPDRKAAEWVFSVGGRVQINGEEKYIMALADLPKEAYRLTGFAYMDVPRVTDESLKIFQGCKNLTSLGLYGARNVTDAGLAYFLDFTNLKELGLADTQVTDAGLAGFSKCKNLTHLSLTRTKITDKGLVPFGDCKHLTYLGLDQTSVTDKGLAIFKDCTEFTMLHLSMEGLSDEGLANFKNYKNLTQLGLEGTKVGDKGLEHLRECVNLQLLGLKDTKVTDAGLVYLKDMKSLGSVDLTNTGITDRGLELLKDHKNLEGLSLSRTQITDAGLAYFKDRKGRWDHLDLEGTQVTDAGLANFKDLKQISGIKLANTRVGDAGLDHFKNVESIDQLDLRKTKVTAAKFEELKKTFPKCKIVSDHGTYEPK